MTQSKNGYPRVYKLILASPLACLIWLCVGAGGVFLLSPGPELYGPPHIVRQIVGGKVCEPNKAKVVQVKETITERVSVPAKTVVMKGDPIVERIPVAGKTVVTKGDTITERVAIPGKTVVVKGDPQVDIVILKPSFPSCVDLMADYLPDNVVNAPDIHQDEAMRQLLRARSGEM